LDLRGPTSKRREGSSIEEEKKRSKERRGRGGTERERMEQKPSPLLKPRSATV